MFETYPAEVSVPEVQPQSKPVERERELVLLRKPAVPAKRELVVV